mmetsp:Transcript_20839/g.67556  ORF Transcript_20839/g.67556 Transcript_20839/m.67556 type:complete len:243 (-) Transcript_20839:1400-2128(-)
MPPDASAGKVRCAYPAAASSPSLPSCTARHATPLASAVSSGGGASAATSRAPSEIAVVSRVAKPSMRATSCGAWQHDEPHMVSGQRGSCAASPPHNRARRTSEKSSGAATGAFLCASGSPSPAAQLATVDAAHEHERATSSSSERIKGSAKRTHSSTASCCSTDSLFPRTLPPEPASPPSPGGSPANVSLCNVRRTKKPAVAVAAAVCMTEVMGTGSCSHSHGAVAAPSTASKRGSQLQPSA